MGEGMGADEERERGVGRRLGMEEDPREWPLGSVGWGGRGVVLSDRWTRGGLTYFLFISWTVAMRHGVLGSWPRG